MWHSLRLSHLCLRVSLAFVFLWFGIDGFFHPVVLFHVSNVLVGYGLGVAELLIGISLASSMFVNLFSGIGIIILLLLSLSHGFSEAVIQDIAISGGLLALSFWPNRSFRNH